MTKKQMRSSRKRMASRNASLRRYARFQSDMYLDLGAGKKRRGGMPTPLLASGGGGIIAAVMSALALGRAGRGSSRGG